MPTIIITQPKGDGNVRIVWKDGVNSKVWKPLTYRGYTITSHGGGWVVNLPGDGNIYRTQLSALNAIDKILGGKTRKDATNRQSKGIQIIGQKIEAQ